jgi:hypothetical protein
MLARRISPYVLAPVALLTMALDIALPELRPYTHSAVYFLAGLLCLEVANDYDHRLMRLSWMLFSGEAFILALHFPLGTPAVTAWLGETRREYVALAMVQMGLTSLLAGMVVTWWQLRRFGLGFHALRRDWAAVALILTGMAVFFALSVQGGWMFPMMASARVLLFLAAAVSVLLNRFCLQMGGGEIARVIRFFIAYVATRCAMNVLFAINKTWSPVAPELHNLLSVLFPWIFLFGVALRARVAVRAEVELARVAAAPSSAAHPDW